MKRIFLCNWFFIAKCIGDYVLDFVLVNVWLAAGGLLLLLSFFQWKWSNLWWLNMSNGEGSSRSYSFWNRNGSKFEVSKGIKTSSKKQPQKSWTTLFTTPFINHFREWAHFIYYPFINCYSTLSYCWWKKSGKPVEVGSLSGYLQGIIHPREPTTFIFRGYSPYF